MSKSIFRVMPSTTINMKSRSLPINSNIRQQNPIARDDPIPKSTSAESKNHIGAYSTMIPFIPKGFNENTKAYMMRYRIGRCYTINASFWEVTDYRSILAARHLQRWAERKDTLWWSALGATLLSPKRTVRSHHARRLRLAFVESLEKQGFATDGSCLPGGKQTRPLFGTVGLGALQPMLKMKYEAVVTQTDLAVAHLIKSQNWASGTYPQSRGLGSKQVNMGRDNWHKKASFQIRRNNS